LYQQVAVFMCRKTTIHRVLGLALLLGFSAPGIKVNALPSFLSDDQQLSLPATGDIKFDRIRSLSINVGAPIDTFGNPKKFPHLEGVGLSAAGDNDHFLQQLTINYPQLKDLSIRQHAALSDESLQRLKSFTHLNTFSLDAPIANGESLAKSLPPTLSSLMIGPNNNITNSTQPVEYEFPSLKRLDIRGGTVSAAFFQDWKASGLKQIFFGNVTLSEGALAPLHQLPTLKSIDLYRSPLSQSDTEILKSHHVRVTHKSGNE